MSFITRYIKVRRFNIFSSRLLSQHRHLISPLSLFVRAPLLTQIRSMKRKATNPAESPTKKATKIKEDDYCNVKPNLDAHGDPIWPAPSSQIIAAQAFLKDWYLSTLSCPACSANTASATAQQPTLIVPDKDADGLSAGVIVHRTLAKLGLDPKHLDVHHVQKGSNIHEEDEREAMLEKKPSWVIVLDQGSRGGPPVIDDPEARSLIVDHHLSDDFPEGALVSSSRQFISY